MDECHAALMPPHQSGAAQSASTECLIGDPMHLMEKPIDCFNIVSGERIFDDRPNLLKSFSWSHGSPRHQAASASRGTMEAAKREVFWHLHLTLLSGWDWSTPPPLRAPCWRRGWDSNPRESYPSGGFQDRCLKPLGHPSSTSQCRGFAQTCP